MSTERPATDEVSQGPPDTPLDRLRRAPSVLRSYARDVEKYGKPLDSGLPALLEFLAAELPTLTATEADHSREHACLGDSHHGLVRYTSPECPACRLVAEGKALAAQVAMLVEALKASAPLKLEDGYCWSYGDSCDDGHDPDCKQCRQALRDTTATATARDAQVRAEAVQQVAQRLRNSDPFCRRVWATDEVAAAILAEPKEPTT